MIQETLSGKGKEKDQRQYGQATPFTGQIWT